MGKMKDLILEGQYKDIVQKYLDGNMDAIALIDTAIGASLDTCYLRGSHDERLDNLEYHDERGEIDMAIDSIEPYMDALGLRAPIQDKLDEIDLDNGYAYE